LDTGFIHKVRTVLREDFIGKPLNRAARLAFLDGLQGRAVASSEFVQHAKDAKEQYRKRFFDQRKSGVVKSMPVHYHLLESTGFIHRQKVNLALTDLKPEPMHVLVVDVAKFTKRDEDNMIAAAEQMARIVAKAFQDLGHQLGKHAFIPAGDGGALVFQSNEAHFALEVARKIREATLEVILQVHLGLDSGQMVRRDPALPLGPAVFGADKAAQESSEWRICLTRQFLEKFPEKDAENLRADPILKIIGADELSPGARFESAVTTGQTAVPGDRADSGESGQLYILDGVMWTKCYDAIRNLEKPLDFVSAHPDIYLHALQSLTSAAILSSAIGYDRRIADLDSERHPVNQLRASGFGDRVVEIEPENPFDLERAAQEHFAELCLELSQLSFSGMMKEHYRELVLRDADRFLLQKDGNAHPSLLVPKLPFREYVFGKSYTDNEDLCRAVNKSFAAELARELEPRYKNHTIPRSREAFVRRVMATHLPIGFNYRQRLKVKSGSLLNVVADTQHVLGTPTRSKAALVGAANGGQPQAELFRYATPLCLRELGLLIERGAKPTDALNEIRNAEWARTVRKLMRDIDGKLELGDRTKAQALATGIVQRRRLWVENPIGTLFALMTAPTKSVDKQMLFALHQKEEDKATRDTLIRYFRLTS